MNLLGDDIDAMKENTETFIDASGEIDVEINVKKAVAVSSPECRSKSGRKNRKQII
jgi:hypothetical protein